MPDPRFFRTAKPLSIDGALKIAGAERSRDGGAAVSRAAGMEEPDLTGAVVFAEGVRELEALGVRKVSLCLTTPAAAAEFRGDGALGLMTSPKLGFARVATALHQSKPFNPNGGLRPAKLGKAATIHESAVIGDGAEIGAGCVIGPRAVIGPGVVMGDACVIGPGAVVTHAILGRRVTLLAGAVVGEAGFGFVPGPDGAVRMPQLGRVLIGDDVEVGANSCVDRGALADTVIGDGVKIDNLVQVGHNVRIGPGSVIAAQTGVSGSVTIGAGVLLGGQVGMADHLTIGAGAQLAAQSGVMRDVPPGEKWAGAPAKPVKAWFREITLLANLAARKKADGHEQD